MLLPYLQETKPGVTTAEALFNSCIVHYGFPKRIHSDQWANFESGLLKESYVLSQVWIYLVQSPYHPVGNGMTERMNRSFLSMLGTLDPARKHMPCTLPKKPRLLRTPDIKGLLGFGHPRNTACGCVNY